MKSGIGWMCVVRFFDCGWEYFAGPAGCGETPEEAFKDWKLAQK
jgi:hypothetical protein